jgi:hypothetical protein
MIGTGMVGVFLIIVLAILVIVLKGYALWHAARRSEKWWFIVLLIINTFGILELIYLYFVVGKWHRFQDSGTPPTNTTNTPPENPSTAS